MVEIQEKDPVINPIILNQDMEGIKLTKNSKGYTWDIKIIGLDIPRLKQLNDTMISTFDLNQQEVYK
jgi:hypothetical protein